LVAQSGDKGASRPVLLTCGTPKWSLFGFSKQFLEGEFSEVDMQDGGCLGPSMTLWSP
jgi:hypothetical protein